MSVKAAQLTLHFADVVHNLMTFKVIVAAAFLFGEVKCFSRNPLVLGSRIHSARKMSSLPTSSAGWRTVLSPMQFKVLREKATEPPGFSEKTAGELEYILKKEHGSKYPKEGAFTCVACNTPLYKATSKFDSGCGWPAFYEGFPGAIKEVPDVDGRRIEIVCSNCESHLGHVFKGEGFPTPTDERHCVNGVSLKYDPANK